MCNVERQYLLAAEDEQFTHNALDAICACSQAKRPPAVELGWNQLVPRLHIKVIMAGDRSGQQNGRRPAQDSKRGSRDSYAIEPCATGAPAGSTILVVDEIASSPEKLCGAAGIFPNAIAYRLPCDALAAAIGAVVEAAGLRLAVEALRGRLSMLSRACQLPVSLLDACNGLSRTAPKSKQGSL